MTIEKNLSSIEKVWCTRYQILVCSLFLRLCHLPVNLREMTTMDHRWTDFIPVSVWVT